MNTGFPLRCDQAALLHFDANNASVPAPIAFVALISCDPGVGTNDTTSNALSSAGNMGASAVILYSETSATCVVSPQLIQTYNATTRAIDIYVTTTAMSASNIQGLFRLACIFSCLGQRSVICIC